MTEAVRASFRRVGLALIIVGTLDTAVMLYCIANDKGYGSSFNIFAVIAGILLMRASVKTAQIVAEASAFLLACFIGVVLAMPLTVPIGYLGAQIRIHTASTIGALLVATLLLVFLRWIHKALTAPAAISAIRDAGLKPPRSVAAYAIGLILAGSVSIGTALFARGEAAEAVVEKVKQEHGSHQQYFLSSFGTTSIGNVRTMKATVTGYSRNSINTYEVAWVQ